MARFMHYNKRGLETFETKFPVKATARDFFFLSEVGIFSILFLPLFSLMNNLPAEIVLAIVRTVREKDLHALTLVNRHFYTVANPILWRDVEILDERQFIKLLQGTLQSQGGLFQHIRSLYLDAPMTDTLLLTLIQLLPPSFQELELPNAEHITDQSLKHLPTQCPQLTSLCLEFADMTNQSMVSLGQQCRQLRILSLIECNKLSPNLFTALTDCPLEEIYIEGKLIRDIQDDATARRLALHLVDFPRLRLLSLVDVYEPLVYRLFTTRDRNGNSPWPRLTVYRLESGCRGVEDEDAIRFIKAHPHLKELDFSASYFSDTVLEAMADGLPDLTLLNLSGGCDFTHRSVLCIIKQCPRLVYFELSDTSLEKTDFPELGAEDDDDAELRGLTRYDMDMIRRASNHNNNNNNNDNDNNDAIVSNE
ncbi:unnamed protein product [Absidia cylindrospora]